MTSDEKYMARCLRLARPASGYTSPNPLVGSVVVHNGRIIGEAYHQKYGEPHAEPLAIRQVVDQSLLAESTLYVNLEPCSHYGKTPPCAELIVSKKIKRVVIAALDPNPKVSGAGVEILKKAGIEVTVGVLEQEALELNKRFYTFHREKRPYVTIKWAQTTDGMIDATRHSADEAPLSISNAITRRLTHKMRTENRAILVSTNTVLLDNPSLTVRFWSGRNPVRIALDQKGRIPVFFHIKDGTVETVIYTSKNNKSTSNLTYYRPDFNFYDIEKILRTLYELKIDSVLIEGGAQLLRSVIEAGCWDEANVEIAPFSINKEGVKAPQLKDAICDMAKVFDGHKWKHYRKMRIAQRLNK